MNGNISLNCFVFIFYQTSCLLTFITNVNYSTHVEHDHLKDLKLIARWALQNERPIETLHMFTFLLLLSFHLNFASRIYLCLPKKNGNNSPLYFNLKKMYL